MVRPSVFAVVASARREVGAPRSGGVVVVVHSATGGVADVTSSSRTRVELHASLEGMDNRTHSDARRPKGSMPSQRESLDRRLHKVQSSV